MSLIKVCQFLSDVHEIKSVQSLHEEGTLDKISGVVNNAGAEKDLLVVGFAELTVRPANQIARRSCDRLADISRILLSKNREFQSF